MVKRTSTIQATIKDAQKLVKKQKKPRTSTIDETVATASQGFKAKKKATKTKTMVQTLKDAAPKAKVAKKTKKVAKKANKKAGAKKANKAKASKKKWFYIRSSLEIIWFPQEYKYFLGGKVHLRTWHPLFSFQKIILRK